MRFTVIGGNELVEYSSIQNRNQILKELFQVFYRWLFLTFQNISEKAIVVEYCFKKVAVLQFGFY